MRTPGNTVSLRLFRMFLLFPVFLAAAPVGGAAEVDLVPLDGPAVAGELVSITAEAVTVRTDGGERAVPVAELAELRFPPGEAPARPDGAALLRDGSTVPVSAVTLSAGTLTAAVPGLGDLAVPAAAVRAVRFRPLAAADVDRWEELVAEPGDADLAVVRRGDRLDRVAGSVGGVSAESVAFLLNGSEIRLPRSRANLVGVVLAGPAVDGKPAAVVRPAAGGVLNAVSVTLDGDALAVTLVAGPTLSLPLAGLASVDFSAGSVTSLAELPTRGPSESTRSWTDEPRPVGRDLNLDGGPIGIAGRAFDRGLVLFAPAELSWRLPKDAARLRAVAGIEDARRELGVGEVDLTISGDGRELFAGRIGHADDPADLDLDLTGVKVLTVSVGPGAYLFDGDHLALGNARITK